MNIVGVNQVTFPLTVTNIVTHFSDGMILSASTELLVKLFLLHSRLYIVVSKTYLS